jgi:adenosylcobinamide amidohydrolase
MAFSHLLLCAFLVTTANAARSPAYTAVLEPFGDNSQVSGEVVVFIGDDDTTVAYAGSATMVEADLTAATCTAKNGKTMREKLLPQLGWYTCH